MDARLLVNTWAFAGSLLLSGVGGAPYAVTATPGDGAEPLAVDLGGMPEPAPDQVMLDSPVQALRGTVVGTQDGLLRVSVGAETVLVRPPAGPPPALATRVEVYGPVPLGDVFEAESVRVLEP